MTPRPLRQGQGGKTAGQKRNKTKTNQPQTQTGQQGQPPKDWPHAQCTPNWHPGPTQQRADNEYRRQYFFPPAAVLEAG